jgi:peptide/nickel transport system substrate-binding protein
MNTFREPLNNRKVRQALNYAVNWDRIMKTVLRGYAYRTTIPCTPYDFGCSPTIKGYDYNPTLAKKLLAEAGFPDGFETTLDSPNGRYLMDKVVAQALAGELANVGIRARVSIQEWGVYYNQRFLGKKIEGLGLFGMGNPIFDVDHLMSVHFDPSRRSIYFNTPDLTRLAEAGMTTPDPAKRKRIYDQAMRLIVAEAPWIFGYGQMDIYGTSKRLVWSPRPDEELPMFEAKLQ